MHGILWYKTCIRDTLYIMRVKLNLLSDIQGMETCKTCIEDTLYIMRVKLNIVATCRALFGIKLV